jgi:hypothetical protein
MTNKLIRLLDDFIEETGRSESIKGLKQVNEIIYTSEKHLKSIKINISDLSTEEAEELIKQINIRIN